ncbi:DUF6547 family protein [Stenotrophomonas maltophilia]|uniref:DUF6547 family protein n=1 Tax=Stenotrophomonas maltophilia TaxID=40324 RepID=UPI002895046B|nr:DUF6547 family protein [Stenotrophomonas maltophilia]MDT3487659.1 DUF6547 family protein [Stenotrophomonas maltophilia]
MTSRTSAEAYQTIIDDLVRCSEGCVSAQRLEKTPPLVGEQAVAALSYSLTDDQRKRVAEALRSERSAAIHDALVILAEWIDCRGLTLHLDGEVMPVDLSGMGLHGDFVGRATGWEWPESDGQ